MRPAGFDYKTSTGLGERETLNRNSLGGHKQNLAHSETQRKGAVTSQETEPKLPASTGGLPVEAWVRRSSPQGQGHWQVPLGVNPLGGLGRLRPKNDQGGNATPSLSR